MATCHRARYNKMWVDRHRDRLNVSNTLPIASFELKHGFGSYERCQIAERRVRIANRNLGNAAGLRLDPWNARGFQPASRSITANCCMDHRHRQPASEAPASGSRSTHRSDDALRPTLYVSYQRRLINSITQDGMRRKTGLSLELITRRWYQSAASARDTAALVRSTSWKISSADRKLIAPQSVQNPSRILSRLFDFAIGFCTGLVPVNQPSDDGRAKTRTDDPLRRGGQRGVECWFFQLVQK